MGEKSEFGHLYWPSGVNTYLMDVKGEPVPWTAPKRSASGGMYQDNQDLKDWEAKIKAECIKQYHGDELDCPIHIDLSFRRTPPESWTKWKRNFVQGRLVARKPDRDNLAKAVYDGMEDANVMLDDGRIASGSIVKRWRWWSKGGKPGVMIRIVELMEYPDRKSDLTRLEKEGKIHDAPYGSLTN